MEPVRERRWLLKEPDDGLVALVHEASLPALVARLLVNRGIETPEQAQIYLSGTLADCHDPFLMQGMDEATGRLCRAWREQELVCVYGDYDVDGITATVLLTDFLRSAGIPCFPYIPNRMEQGYGLAADGIKAAADRGARVIVSVDCGVTAVGEAELCRACGIDLIITDHHTPGEVIPGACAVINPHQPGCTFPFKQLAGVGVAFNLVIALRASLREAGAFPRDEVPNLREYLDLVALGTVADVVPLTGENRLFVRAGLRELTAGRRPGIAALKTVARITGEVTAFDVGFRLAPRLNACGRLEDAIRGVELLQSHDMAAALPLAEELDVRNVERQRIEQEILREAVDMLKAHGRERTGIVLASTKWHPGVVGIVASRIVDLFHRPTVLVALKDGSGRGSGRSIPGFHLYEALCACEEYLQAFGGHTYAAGLSLTEESLVSFAEEFDAVAMGALSADDLVPEILIDADLSPGEVVPGLAKMVAALEPWGAGNPPPLFLLRAAPVAGRRVLKEKHLKLRLDLPGGQVDAIAFGRGEFACGDEVDIVFTPETTVWNGRERLQLKIKDIRNSEGGKQ